MSIAMYPVAQELMSYWNSKETTLPYW